MAKIKIDPNKGKNKAKIVWFCVLAGISVLLLIQALVYKLHDLSVTEAADKWWVPTNPPLFLIACPIFFLLICLLLARSIIKTSKDE